ncbi:MAG TPA: ABC transporter permease [Candidatus Pullichristensenella avicola]|nr:ABC transporter permease [Candidatus Pullichristensenella avicola]
MEAKAILRRFLRRPTAVIGMVLLIIIVLAAIFAPVLAPYDPLEQDLLQVNKPFSAEHLLGTDYLGRDTLSRILYGARVSLSISLTGVLLGSIVGIVIGLVAGYYGGALDYAIEYLLTILMAYPGLLLALIIIAIFGTSNVNTMLAIAVFIVPTMARTVRGLTFSLREQEYIQACKVAGASDARIIFKHVLPNCFSQIIVNCTLSFGGAILTVSGLSYLGVGIQPPTPEWGMMISNARATIRTFPAGILVPGIAVTLAVMAFSLVGDGLRDALDPKLKNQ